MIQTQAKYNGLPQMIASNMFIDPTADQRLLDCSPLQLAKVRNHTCVCELRIRLLITLVDSKLTHWMPGSKSESIA
jgi:hypothetical protein